MGPADSVLGEIRRHRDRERREGLEGWAGAAGRESLSRKGASGDLQEITVSRRW